MGAKQEEAFEPSRAREVIARDGGQVLDLRDGEEFASAHIAGAIRPEGDDVDSALDSFDEDRPLIVVCEDGGRSAEVAESLRDRGYQAAVIKGGMKGWMGDGMPTIPRETEEFHGPGSAGP
jgi:rhodanese-related sulfurtransferase